uniref:Uncharacterized protein n=1 Tax=Tanacetum cinerariifolium TaxID=118510 RepID=A0A699GPP3_TANCI|nr:hypothetical protein [Tanacetum cinerariifolium]
MTAQYPFKPIPVDVFLQALSMSKDPRVSRPAAVQLLCNWWNEESGCAANLRCAGSLVIWVSRDGGLSFEPANPDLGPTEPHGLFSQASWRSSIAACGTSILIAYLKDATQYVLDKQGFLGTYLVNGTLFESIGIDSYDYQAGAIDALDMRETAKSWQGVMPHSAKVMYRLIAMLQHSVKFILPNCCELVAPDDLRQAHIDMLRLPFQCVAFEAPWDKGGEIEEYIGEFRQTPATRRIALCWDSAQFEPRPGLNSFLDAFPQGGAFVLPIFWAPQFKKWSVALGGIFVPYNNKLEKININEALPGTRIAFAAKLAAGHAHEKSSQFRSEPFPMFPEIFEAATRQDGSREKTYGRILLDASDEVSILIQVCSVINCANVETGVVEASAALNRKRQANGKQPFFSYKILELSADRQTKNTSYSSGEHASPRMHLRRGHLRRLDNKTVWVRAAMVNIPSSSGSVHKDYRVTPPPLR